MKRAALALTVMLAWSWGGAARAGRPLTIDDAEPVARGHLELEAGFVYVKDSPLHHYDIPLTLTYGVLDRVEIGLGFGGQWERRDDAFGLRENVEGIGDLFAGFKWKVLDAQRHFADHALAVSVKFPTADEDRGLGSGEVDYDFTWIISRAITDHLAAHFNIGYTRLGDPDDVDLDDVLHYGVAGTWRLTRKIEPVLEVFADTPVHSGQTTAVVVNGGVRWHLRDDLVLDAAMGTAARGDAPDLLLTVGLTLAF